ncbi:MAG: hypothetical protein GF353_28580 [Candidatus Lokiarchaeota archaeon]|nr:hypothetical protein [Candidatus Lokiarchaeota archaeon]MBD3353959.1 hypothetical protein [Candidatus Lokiarchaeota archaeon]
MTKVQKASKSRVVYKNETTYGLLNAALSGIFMVAAYLLYIVDLEKDLSQLGIIILVAVITGMIGSWVARLITRVYSQLVKPLNYYLRTILIDLFYGLLIWIGFLTYIWDEFEFLEILFIWVILKMMLFFTCDYFADKATFGG